MTAIFTGSFDPYTIGHDDILRRALPLFDTIVIGVGHNERKQYMHTLDERVEAIRRLYAHEPKVSVEAYTDLTVDFAKRVGASVIVKGVRSIKDFEYEREQAELNRHLGGGETLLLFADPALAGVSSSAVRELAHFGRDIQEFIPKP